MVFQCDNASSLPSGNISPYWPTCTKDNYPRSYWWLEVPVLGVVCVIGLIGNVLALMVWRSNREHRQSLFLLQILAVTDNFYLLVTVIVLPVNCLFPQIELSLMQISPLTYYLQNAAQSLCILMIVLVTAERYIFVCRPLQASRIIKTSRKCWLVGLVYVFGLLYNLPYLLCYCTQALWKQPKPGCYRGHLKIALPVSRFVLMFLIPVVALSVMSVCLIRALWMLHRRHTMTSLAEIEHVDLGDDDNIAESDLINQPVNHQRDRDSENYGHITSYTPFTCNQTLRMVSPSATSEGRTTALLLVIVIIFILCQLPEIIYNAVRLPGLLANTSVNNTHVFTNKTFIPAPGDFLVPVSQLTLVINSSINCFVYLAFGKEFRRRFIAMFAGGKLQVPFVLQKQS